jgi:SAM-dependent methyltransferase
MAHQAGFDLARRLYAEACAARVTDSVHAFGNLSIAAQYRLAYEITAKYVRPGDRTLDWGCGDGHYSYFLSMLGADVTSFSFDDAPACMTGHARYRHIRQRDPRRLPFPDGHFDCTCNVGVIEHVWETGGEETESLAELLRITKAGGVFLTFHLPNRAGWVESVARVLRAQVYRHGRRYGADQVQRLWGDAGFDVIEMGLYNFLPRNETRRLPARLQHSIAFGVAYNFLDDALTSVARRWCQNYFVVARRPMRAPY